MLIFLQKDYLIPYVEIPLPKGDNMPKTQLEDILLAVVDDGKESTFVYALEILSTFNLAEFSPKNKRKVERYINTIKERLIVKH